jgi:hypothetical protein
MTKFHSFSSCCASLVGLICSALLVGCGGGYKEAADSVTGTITVKGEKAGAGTITFHGSKDVVGTITDGKYKVDNPPIGQVKVSLRGIGGPTVAEAAGKKLTGEAGKAVEGKGGLLTAGGGATIPKKYESPETSGLTYEVKAGKTTKDFDLEP